MRLVEMLEKLGDRLGILEKSSALRSGPGTKIHTRTVSLSDLASELHGEEVRMLAESPAELQVPFRKIYDAAGVPAAAPAWNLSRLRQLLATPEFQGLERNVLQRRLLGILGDAGVDPEGLVREAVAMDRALDAFEDFAGHKLRERSALRERRRAEIAARIQELDAESEKLGGKDAAESREWQEWLVRKRAEEKDLAWLVGYLVDRTVITTADKAISGISADSPT